MLDPVSFAAGGAVMVAGKLLYDAACITCTHTRTRTPCDFPPPPPMPKNKVRIRMFVDDMESILNMSLGSVSDTAYIPICTKDSTRILHVPSDGARATSEGDDAGTVRREDTKVKKRIRTDQKFTVSNVDLLRIKLKPTTTRDQKKAIVNQSPICTDCIAQKDRLKRVNELNKT